MIKYIKNTVFRLFFMIGFLSMLQVNYAQSLEGVVISKNANKEVNKNSMLEVEAEDKGVLLPRMSFAALQSIAPLLDAEGLTVYVTDDDEDIMGLYTFTSGGWVRLSAIGGESEFYFAPLGSIVMYHGDLAFFDDTGKGFGPCEGWVICNGKYGSPDMRGLFVAGAGNNFQPNYPSNQTQWLEENENKHANEYASTGASDKKGNHVSIITPENLGSHTHDITSDGSVTSSINFEVKHKHKVEVEVGYHKDGTIYSGSHEISTDITNRRKTNLISRRRPGNAATRGVRQTAAEEVELYISDTLVNSEGEILVDELPKIRVKNGNDLLGKEPVPYFPGPYWYDNRPLTYYVVYILRTDCTDCEGKESEDCINYQIDQNYKLD